MWTFKDAEDKRWIEAGGLQAMAACGLRIYTQEDLEYVFGVDGCDYDFYTQYWIPLYRARGLMWHE
jgi:hypothetical protein